MYVYVYMHEYVCMGTCTHMGICMHACGYICSSLDMCNESTTYGIITSAFRCMYVCICMSMYSQAHAHVWACACMHMDIYVVY